MANKYSLVFFFYYTIFGEHKKDSIIWKELYVRTDTELQLYIAMVAILVMWDGRTAPGVCCNGSVPLSHSGNVVTRIGIHTHLGHVS